MNDLNGYYGDSNGYYSCNTTMSPLMLYNGTIINPSGYVYSPKYPEPYPNNSSCWSTIHVGDGFIIHLSFIEFEIEEG